MDQLFSPKPFLNGGQYNIIYIRSEILSVVLESKQISKKQQRSSLFFSRAFRRPKAKALSSFAGLRNMAKPNLTDREKDFLLSTKF